MKTASALAIALFALSGAVIADASAQSPSASNALLLLPPANRIVGTWEFQVHIFDCDTGQTRVRFRAASVFNAGGTMVDTNNAPPTTRGPAFGVWNYDRRNRNWTAQMRLYRYNPDGSFAGVNEVRRTLTLAPGDDQMTEAFTGQILGPNEEVLAETCGEGEGTRSL
ncbi:hypothetical protein [Luteimonas sp. MC1895]|uniref:hypothetical protein n=1 Tax=Luteimonas sp. MC1895 TaxID=2819513 RepID=UPI0018F06415|nr:hypothetical protein [Luteimonas sp. MC1895]MBJ6980043.1 hypothetical protein [Luteimonas sp. MC1895]